MRFLERTPYTWPSSQMRKTSCFEDYTIKNSTTCVVDRLLLSLMDLTNLGYVSGTESPELRALDDS